MFRKEIAIRPWRRGVGNDAHKVFDDQGRIVAEGCGFCDGNLIAAAPDLLEALVAVVAVADRKTDEFDRAKAAIAKANATD